MLAMNRLAPRASRAAPAVRGFATEKEIAMRITATKNIQKITASMKMVSQAKLTVAKRGLIKSKPFSNYLDGFLPVKEDSATSDLALLDGLKNPVVVPLTSDTGFCGGCNSYVTKQVKHVLGKFEENGASPTLMIVGNKGRGQLRRGYGEMISAACIDVKRPFTFEGAASLASEVMKTETDGVVVVYNTFVSAIAYTPTLQVVLPLAKAEGEALVDYDCEPDTKEEILTDLFEYSLASALYCSYTDSVTAELSARVTAMENASKNAGELIDKLTLIYNRTRQARITTELIEIISGASALEGK